MSKVIVIGGGASGLVSAIIAARNGNDVLLLEKNNNCGKKLLMTGNGKCNYWNKDMTLKHYRSKNMRIVGTLLSDENLDKVMNFFDSLGIIPKIKNGYFYPTSLTSTSIQNSLLVEAKQVGVEIINNAEVIDIVKTNEFIVETQDFKYKADKVILATGSKACPKSGSTGFGYELLKKYNHEIIEPLPALVQIKGTENYFSQWAGIRTEVDISLFENFNFIHEENGEIQLTDYGISGICSLQLSGRAARGLKEGRNEYVFINFLPTIGRLTEFMDERSKKIPNRTVIEQLETLLNYKLLYLLVKRSSIDINKKWEELNECEKEILEQNLQKFYLEITGTKDFDNAQVCSGGLSLEEINIETLESMKVKDLYITGELLDIDGDCGGYNLGMAWITGIISGESVGKAND